MVQGTRETVQGAGDKGDSSRCRGQGRQLMVQGTRETVDSAGDKGDS